MAYLRTAFEDVAGAANNDEGQAIGLPFFELATSDGLAVALLLVSVLVLVGSSARGFGKQFENTDARASLR